MRMLMGKERYGATIQSYRSIKKRMDVSGVTRNLPSSTQQHVFHCFIIFLHVVYSTSSFVVEESTLCFFKP